MLPSLALLRVVSACGFFSAFYPRRFVPRVRNFYSLHIVQFSRQTTCIMLPLRTIVAVLLMGFVAFNSHAQSNDYQKLSHQEKADLARYLGWVWGDGRPGYDGTGILYKGGNPNYKATVDRLSKIRFDGKTNPFGFPVSGDRKLTNVWNYWNNSLPGGNPGDPNILREAIKHPNFLAGIIEGEGQVFHSDPNAEFYIADQSYSPSHPDKIYDIAYFGPERMIQLFSLLEETYGFNNPAMSIGNIKYQYNTHRCVVMEHIREEYNDRKNQNERGNLQSAFTVKIFIKPQNFTEIRSYGYFHKNNGQYRTPAPDTRLDIINSALTDQNTEVNGPMTFFEANGVAGLRLLNGSGYYVNSALEAVSLRNNSDLSWKLIDLNNGYYRITSLDSPIRDNALQALNNGVLRLADGSNNWHLTQWEKVPVPNTRNRYYLKNRFHNTFLRIGANESKLKHGFVGGDTRWSLEEVSGCAQ